LDRLEKDLELNGEGHN